MSKSKTKKQYKLLVLDIVVSLALVAFVVALMYLLK